MKPILYSFYRSSCAYRIRIALNLKGISYEIRPVDLFKDENSTDEFRRLNPKGEVPVLIIDGKNFTQSLPIIEYLDETYKLPKLLPDNPYQRYQVRMISEIIGSGIQPLQNVSVLRRVGDERKVEWVRYYINKGLNVLEKALEESAGQYSVGDQLSIADCFLVPQLYTARLWRMDLKKYQIISSIEKRLNEISEFKAAHPDLQPDCPKTE